MSGLSDDTCRGAAAGLGAELGCGPARRRGPTWPDASGVGRGPMRWALAGPACVRRARGSQWQCSALCVPAKIEHYTQA
eukprot:7377080-Prymnesium_polylepis.2